VYLPGGKYYKSFGSKGTGKSKFGYPYGIVVLKNGEIAVADSINLNVRVFSNSGKYKKTLIDAKQKIRPGALAVDKKGQIYISDLLNHQIVVISPAGKIVRKFKPNNASLKYPQEVAFSSGGQNLWVADSGNFAVKEIDTKGLVAQTIKGWGSPQRAFSLVRGVGVDNLNRLMIADTINGTIHVVGQDGREIFSFGGQDGPNNNLIYPSFILVDRTGKIYITDRGTGQVQVWGYKN
jgi:tripartite motif-containing protein 71